MGGRHARGTKREAPTVWELQEALRMHDAAGSSDAVLQAGFSVAAAAAAGMSLESSAPEYDAVGAVEVAPSPGGQMGPSPPRHRRTASTGLSVASRPSCLVAVPARPQGQPGADEQSPDGHGSWPRLRKQRTPHGPTSGMGLSFICDGDALPALPVGASSLELRRSEPPCSALTSSGENSPARTSALSAAETHAAPPDADTLFVGGVFATSPRISGTYPDAPPPVVTTKPMAREDSLHELRARMSGSLTLPEAAELRLDERRSPRTGHCGQAAAASAELRDKEELIISLDSQCDDRMRPCPTTHPTLPAGECARAPGRVVQRAAEDIAGDGLAHPAEPHFLPSRSPASWRAVPSDGCFDDELRSGSPYGAGAGGFGLQSRAMGFLPQCSQPPDDWRPPHGVAAQYDRFPDSDAHPVLLPHAESDAYHHQFADRYACYPPVYSADGCFPLAAQPLYSHDPYGSMSVVPTSSCHPPYAPRFAFPDSHGGSCPPVHTGEEAPMACAVRLVSLLGPTVSSPHSAHPCVLSPVPTVAAVPLAQPCAVPAAGQPPPDRRPPPRNAVERREWTVEEDDLIRRAVVAEGCRWRKIASMLPHRSDDAVRNRWNRIRADAYAAEPALAGSCGGEVDEAVSIHRQLMPLQRRARRSAEAGPSSPEVTPRVSWSYEEDAVIFASVAELGHRWFIIAQRLPGRTEHAIRNRYHRLGAMVRQDPGEA